MIRLELEIKARKLSPQQEEELRMAIRQATLPFIFQVVDATATRNGWDMNHTDVGVTGDIKIESPVS